jgi:hypothetical protein
MKPSVVAVEAKDSSVERLRATDPGAKGEGPPAVRFLYPSGSQPLPGYTVKRGIGHGGFGEVYYAVSDAGKEVALKLIRRNLDIELRGIRHCLNLKHPNLLAIHDIRRDEHGDNWVIMEYVNGRRLEDVIAAHPQGMPRDQALAWLFGTGAGVACLHDHGIVHRDLKPGNIFCDEGVVKLGDYGLSKFISCSRRSGQTESVGTVHYMAPEIANGRYGKEIDIYALGVIFYEMLTGRVPFEGESVGEVLMKHLTTEPDVSGLAEPFRGVIAKALQKDPAKRFKSVPEMLAALPRPQRAEIYAGPLPSAGSGRESTITAAVVPAAGSIPVAEAVDEEPIFRAIKQAYRQARDAWNRSSFNTPTKIALLVVGSCVLMMSSAHWMPVLVFLLLLYACYWVVRAVLTAFAPPQRAGGPSLAAPPPSPAVGLRGPGDAGEQPVLARAAALPPTGAWDAAAPPHPGAWRRHRLPPHDREADVLVLGSPRERAAQLIGSLIGGALVTLVMCLVIMVLNSFRENAPEAALWGWQWWAQYAWLVTVSLAATWAVLIPSKFWEGRPGDAMLRRFLFMVVGLGLGLVALWATGWFTLDLPHDKHLELLMLQKGRPLHLASGWQVAQYYLAAFGTLFLVIRWWRLADPGRTARLSLWSLFVCVFLAAVIADIWGFPQPWLPMAACSVSVAVQLAGTWIHPRDRRWQSPPA